MQDLKNKALPKFRQQANAGMVVALVYLLISGFVIADEYQPREVMTNSGILIYYLPALENWRSVGGPYGDATLPKDPSNCLIAGSFKFVKGEDNEIYLVADLDEAIRSVNDYNRLMEGDDAERMAKRREVYNRHYFKSGSFKPEEGQAYTFSYNNPMRVVKRIKKRIFEVELPADLKSDRQIALERAEARNRVINEAAKKTEDTRRQIQEERIQIENLILSQSSLEQAQKNAGSVKKENGLVFKNLYIGMPTSDALWVLKDLLGANFKVKKGADFDSPKNLRIDGQIKVFDEPAGRNSSMHIRDQLNADHSQPIMQFLDQLNADHSQPMNPDAEVMKDELYDTRPHMDLYFDQSGKVVCFSIPRHFLSKLFKITDISDQQFFDMFKSNYNIQGEISQVDVKQDNVFLTMLSDKFSPEFSTTLSLIDPRGVKIDFAIPQTGKSSTLILQKWATPKEINDSFN